MSKAELALNQFQKGQGKGSKGEQAGFCGVFDKLVWALPEAGPPDISPEESH